MSGSLKAVFFDVDGVLIDSLPQHLKICEDKAIEYGLAIQIPTARQFRARVRRGERVSPMVNFFLMVGFPPDLAERAVADYERDFMTHYRPKPFAGIEAVLRTLTSSGLQLGLVTANTRGNVVPALGEAVRHFNHDGLFFFDDGEYPRSKAWSLTEGARRMGLAGQACAYVGDQPADAEAARAAGFRFLGVTYGWGLSNDDDDLSLAHSLAEVPGKLLGRDGQPPIGVVPARRSVV